MLTPNGFFTWCWLQVRPKCWLLGHISLFFCCFILSWLSHVIFGIRVKVMVSSCGSVIVRKGLLVSHNSTLYNNSKNKPSVYDVKCYKRFEYIFFITNWFWGRVTQLIVWQMVSNNLNYYIFYKKKFKLLYKFRIVAFFLNFPNISTMPILLKF